MKCLEGFDVGVCVQRGPRVGTDIDEEERFTGKDE
jgi:hypothetical protein